MRTEEEIKILLNELENAVDVDSDEYYKVEDDKDFKYLCNVMDAFGWVLGEISTGAFKSDSYINLDSIRRKTKGK